MTPSDPALQAKLTRQLTTLARFVVEDRAPLLDSVRQLNRLCIGLGLRPKDPVLRALATIADETAALPLGPERRAWAAEDLAEQDRLIAEAEARARPAGLEACREILRRYAPPSDNRRLSDAS